MPTRAANPKKALTLLTLSFIGTDINAATTSLTLRRIKFLVFYYPSNGTTTIDP
jgi:hypothetical protein